MKAEAPQVVLAARSVFPIMWPMKNKSELLFRNTKSIFTFAEME
jgi:hypothetical protein